MRTVRETRRVGAPPSAVLDFLDPATVVDMEGTFAAIDTAETDGESRVTARGGGMEVVFAFIETAEGYEYDQLGGAGPFETMQSTLTVTPEDEGSRVTVESEVSLGLPVAAISDRVAAWKRRGEIKRLLRAIEESV
ncbi:SRPBCC family protein [Halanaeroarchaeum sulfurireducens]|uniref:Polyketide cyclase n=1 Tax=Halanaeroarchaeum sulfurireducens TaxID=1604004 RepID=A0A0F7P627_9EURY|nr:SRPBCC family protein [Halanaeroarchaeum sulfurireducens]AKH96631.1 hypothetical protein HLASF_0117 [Halanaeroarchaeum sulfurireducens]ALG81033.1 hypothetical protein HLASA_0117 [Halanaeroarchaeum sulfurireducens]